MKQSTLRCKALTPGGVGLNELLDLDLEDAANEMPKMRKCDGREATDHDLCELPAAMGSRAVVWVRTPTGHGARTRKDGRTGDA